MNQLSFACGTMLFLSLGSLRAQSGETGFLNRVITVGGESRRYQIYVPADYSNRVAWPVILFLHGAGERGTDGLLQTTAGLGPAIRQAPERFPAIVVFPQARPKAHWTGDQADMALAALAKTMSEYHVDANRVYLTGLSLGGHGSWYLAYRHPELFAAVAPICGWTKGSPGVGIPESVVPPEHGASLSALAKRLAKTPLWIFHGEMDSVVPVSASREAAEALKSVSTVVHYTEHLGLDHNSWDATYGSQAFVKWLFAQRRLEP